MTAFFKNSNIKLLTIKNEFQNLNANMRPVSHTVTHEEQRGLQAVQGI